MTTSTPRRRRVKKQPDARPGVDMLASQPPTVPAPVRLPKPRGPANMPGDPIVTERTRITQCPSPSLGLHTNTHAEA
jgi:hypothetical protein